MKIKQDVKISRKSFLVETLWDARRFAVTCYIHLPCTRYCVPSKSCTLTAGMKGACFLVLVATVWVQMGAPVGARMSVPRDKPTRPMPGEKAGCAGPK